MLFPAPEGPTRAIVSPGFAIKEMLLNILSFPLYEKETFLKVTLPFMFFISISLSDAMAFSGFSSSIENILSAEASALCITFGVSRDPLWAYMPL